MKKFHFLLAVLPAIILVIVITGCGTEKNDNQDTQVERAVREFYTDLKDGNYEDAAEMLIFSEATQDMKDLFPSSFSNSPIQSFSIDSIEKFTDDLYKVHVIGINLLPFELIYDESGKVVGTKENPNKTWHIDSFDNEHYAARVDGRWGICISPRYVPEGMYSFTEEDLDGGHIISNMDE